MSRHILSTGQQLCYNESGKPIVCAGSGQDAEFSPGIPWPDPRFRSEKETVHDVLTGLTWSRDANPGVFPCSWVEAFEAIRVLNHRSYCGFRDWRLPNRRELRSLMDYQAKKPALPSGHPFTNVFLHWYWSSTTAAIHPGYAWYVHLEGARMFYGKKSQEALFWPVRGKGNGSLAVTGQQFCYDETGTPVDCRNCGQDGELQWGAPWPAPRFTLSGKLVHDHLTGLIWMEQADLTEKKVRWQQALDAIRELNRSDQSRKSWRLPTINELESLVDTDRHSPALPSNHPFTSLQEGYWASTTSFFETDWAWVLYMKKGACGVGYKPDATFHVWPVTEAVDSG
ncbi:MAG TPA: DUF1566 domain-containing protein, partial [Desulfobulbaceae bacterium]|nr:DUF1566 domain-containing protein [Desulfobulbaceae bacterium]